MVGANRSLTILVRLFFRTLALGDPLELGYILLHSSICVLHAANTGLQFQTSIHVIGSRFDVFPSHSAVLLG